MNSRQKRKALLRWAKSAEVDLGPRRQVDPSGGAVKALLHHLRFSTRREWILKARGRRLFAVPRV